MMAAECLAGRLVTPARLCKQVKTALESQGWRKESVKIAPVRLPDVDDPPQGKTLAIALAPVGVRAVQRLLAAEAAAEAGGGGSAADGQVAALAAMLRDGRVRLAPGLPRAAERGLASGSAAPPAAAFALPALDSEQHDRAGGFLFAELFAGIGGFRLGLESVGGRCVMMAEQDQWCQQTVRRNFPEVGVSIATDVTELSAADVPPHHILTAGFPCQSFSQLGARHGGRDTGADERAGLEDPTRGNLIWHVLRIVEERRPAAMLLENVRGLLTLDGGSAIQTILAGIRAIGYW